ncbi:glucosamine-6-phosphate deaminase [Bacilli bacterium]|nr:glucosamine-6-phosphate deaminase [Bacilli bacterium]
MPQYKLFVCENKEATSIAAAKSLIETVTSKPNAILGLATGGTMVPVYAHMVSDFMSHHTNYQFTHTFNLDEYINLNPLYSSESYCSFMNNHLFDKININKTNIHFPNSKDPAYYDTLIKNSGGIDVQLVGVGVNGHIGFNEPGSSIDSITRVVQLTDSTIKANSRFFGGDDNLVPKFAVSMGIQTILNARKIILVATDINKANAIKHILLNHYDPQ